MSGRLASVATRSVSIESLDDARHIVSLPWKPAQSGSIRWWRGGNLVSEFRTLRGLIPGEGTCEDVSQDTNQKEP